MRIELTTMTISGFVVKCLSDLAKSPFRCQSEALTSLVMSCAIDSRNDLCPKILKWRMKQTSVKGLPSNTSGWHNWISIRLLNQSLLWGSTRTGGNFIFC